MRYVILFALLFASACGQFRGHTDTPADTPAISDAEPGLSDQGDAAATTPDENDTSAKATGLNGPARTIAGLGDPSRPGLWLETPLVQASGPGRVRLVSGGATVSVTLLPAPGEASAGSRLSLEAMRILGVPLTELVEVDVFPSS
jgi:hypothetical protein